MGPASASLAKLAAVVSVCFGVTAHTPMASRVWLRERLAEINRAAERTSARRRSSSRQPGSRISTRRSC